jgi:hypothetical protein
MKCRIGLTYESLFYLDFDIPLLFVILYLFSIWTFIYFFYLDFLITFLFRLLFPFPPILFFFFYSSFLTRIFTCFFYIFSFNRALILTFFLNNLQVSLLFESPFMSKPSIKTRRFEMCPVWNGI